MTCEEIMYNKELANKRGLTISDRNELEQLYEKLSLVLNKPWKVCNSPNLVSKYIYDLECELQRVWKFDVDPARHSYWFRVKGCECPTLDNNDMIGSTLRYYNNNCPYHGSEKASNWDFIDL